MGEENCIKGNLTVELDVALLSIILCSSLATFEGSEEQFRHLIFQWFECSSDMSVVHISVRSL